jgi:hypothetical protein
MQGAGCIDGGPCRSRCEGGICFHPCFAGTGRGQDEGRQAGVWQRRTSAGRAVANSSRLAAVRGIEMGFVRFARSGWLFGGFSVASQCCVRRDGVAGVETREMARRMRAGGLRVGGARFADVICGCAGRMGADWRGGGWLVTQRSSLAGRAGARCGAGRLRDLVGGRRFGVVQAALAVGGRFLGPSAWRIAVVPVAMACTTSGARAPMLSLSGRRPRVRIRLARLRCCRA